MQLSSDEHSPLKTQQFYFPGESLSMTDEDDEDRGTDGDGTPDIGKIFFFFLFA